MWRYERGVALGYIFVIIPLLILLYGWLVFRYIQCKRIDYINKRFTHVFTLLDDIKARPRTLESSRLARSELSEPYVIVLHADLGANINRKLLRLLGRPSWTLCPSLAGPTKGRCRLSEDPNTIGAVVLVDVSLSASIYCIDWKTKNVADIVGVDRLVTKFLTYGSRTYKHTDWFSIQKAVRRIVETTDQRESSQVK